MNDSILTLTPDARALAFIDTLEPSKLWALSEMEPTYRLPHGDGEKRIVAIAHNNGWPIDGFALMVDNAEGECELHSVWLPTEKAQMTARFATLGGAS